MEKVEERGVPQLGPEPLSVEVGQGNEELGERIVLAAEEVGPWRARAGRAGAVDEAGA